MHSSRNANKFIWKNFLPWLQRKMIRNSICQRIPFEMEMNGKSQGFSLLVAIRNRDDNTLAFNFVASLRMLGVWHRPAASTIDPILFLYKWPTTWWFMLTWTKLQLFTQNEDLWTFFIAVRFGGDARNHECVCVCWNFDWFTVFVSVQMENKRKKKNNILICPLSHRIHCIALQDPTCLIYYVNNMRSESQIPSLCTWNKQPEKWRQRNNNWNNEYYSIFFGYFWHASK